MKTLAAFISLLLLASPARAQQSTWWWWGPDQNHLAPVSNSNPLPVTGALPSPVVNGDCLIGAGGVAIWGSCSGAGADVTSVTGTAGQVTVSPTTGNVVVSLPATITQNTTFSGTLVAGGAFSATSAALTTPTIAGATLSGTLAGTPTFSGVPLWSGLSAGTQVSCLGLDSGNHMVLNAAACGSGGGGSGTVTSVTLGVPASSIFGTSGTNPVTTSGTFSITTTGTSGGVPYFSSGTQLSTSAALTANLPVIGGGAGVAPSVGTRSGNTIAFVTTTGSQTSGDCVKIDASGNHVANGSACGSGGSVSVTAGTANIVVTPSPGTGTFTIGTTEAGRDASGSGVAIVTADNTKTVQLGAFTYTLAQAGTAGFASGWGTCLLNVGATAATVTSTTSVFKGAGGATSLTIPSGSFACPVSDGTDYVTTSGSGAASTGTGNVVRATSATLVTPALGTPSALVLTNATGLPAAQVPAVLTPTPATTHTLTAPREYYACTGTCTVTVPVPAAGYEFCVFNDDNVATAITLGALGSSAMYENSARTAYGTAGTGTLVLSAAAANKVCLVGRDSTHYWTLSYNGTVTVN